MVIMAYSSTSNAHPPEAASDEDGGIRPQVTGHTINHIKQAVRSYISERSPFVPFTASCPISHPCWRSLIRVHMSDGLRPSEVSMVDTPFVGIVG